MSQGLGARLVLCMILTMYASDTVSRHLVAFSSISEAYSDMVYSTSSAGRCDMYVAMLRQGAGCPLSSPMEPPITRLVQNRRAGSSRIICLFQNLRDRPKPPTRSLALSYATLLMIHNLHPPATAHPSLPLAEFAFSNEKKV